MAKRSPLVGPSVITEESLKNIAKEMRTILSITPRMTISDDEVTGLRIVVSKDGEITFHASYHYGDKRPNLKLGDFDPKSPDHMSLKDARYLTNAIKILASNYGINVEDEVSAARRNLLQDVLKRGTKWRPRAH